MKLIGKGLAWCFMVSGVWLVLCCGGFYIKSYRENLREEQRYEEIRADCSSAKKEKRRAGDVKQKKKNEDGNRNREEIRESFGISWESLRKINSDISGWIDVPGTRISYPIVQGQDDEFYLVHSVEGKKSPFGSIFLGCGHRKGLEDSHSLIYGHNMEGRMMFADLNLYENQGFFEENPEFVITTPERRLVYKIFSVEQAREDSISFVYGYKTGSREYEAQQEALKAGSLYETGVLLDCEKEIVSLVTCNSRLDENVRMVVHGILQ